MSDDDDAGRVLRFPHSRVAGRNYRRAVKELGYTPLARELVARGKGATGHWCSRCAGVWYGQAGEVECPVCGNRHG